ncbi:SDR family NAD(P)-dependent oxidoreductase [Halioglobus pacificus]|uniref:SDR family NAD(P)-dependent oxidoreductase n=1 Tax=Parahalioglobus pacificus TaxID=930806 RepID=UPI00357111AA
MACAEALANQGMRIALVDKDAEKLAEAASSLPASCEAHTFCTDVTDRAALSRLSQFGQRPQRYPQAW